MRSSGRRSGGQYERRRDEEYGREEETPRPGRGQDADSLIADMAKGFVEAQAKIAGAPADGNDREMLAMLAKISRQLDELKSAPAGGQQAQEQGQEEGQEQASDSTRESAGQGANNRQDDLSAIFSRLLAENKPAPGPKQQSGASQQSTGKQNNASQQDGGARQQSGSGAQASEQAGGQNQGKGGSQGTAGGQSVTAQTAAQALAQAQYELANELEASLTKLKQVISESEKLADRISNLLGQENSSRQT